MPATIPRIPAYRLHKPSGLAVVTMEGRDHYLGRYGSDISKTEYQRLIGEWCARGRPLTGGGRASGDSTVNEIMLGYVEYSLTYYRDADGRTSREPETMKLAFRPLKALYGHTDAQAFGPLALKTVRQKMIESGLARSVINQRIGYIKRMFRWASEQELIPPGIYHGLDAVTALQRGRSAAKETTPVSAVPDEYVDAVLPFLPPTLQAMVGVQRLTGMRSGELVRLTSSQIDMSRPTWIYRPRQHKSAYLGRPRMIPLGSRCQALLGPFLQADPEAFLFSPRQSQAERRAIRRAARKSPVQPPQLSRRRDTPKRAPGDRYNPRSYHAALRFGMRAAQRAGALSAEIFWHPHQLRHSTAARLQRDHGLEAARAFLGHAKLDITAHYAGIDERVIMELGAQYA
jgi:integrase